MNITPFVPAARFSPASLLKLALLLLSVVPAWSQVSLTGTVTNAATGRALQGARVVADGAARETLTDSDGSYRLEGFAPGSASLSVSYTGLDVARVQVELAAGSNRRDVALTSGVYRMDQFVVAGEREGNAQAVTLQRLSNGVKNIVSTDAFGNLAQNPADLLVRLPGVEGDTVDGTIRYVRIRGLSQNLVSITMDGNRLADAASAGATREYQFQTVSADTVERLEVTKSPTPDMDGDSIGGAVNMVSKTGFDTKGRLVRISAELTYRPFDDRMQGAPYN